MSAEGPERRIEVTVLRPRQEWAAAAALAASHADYPAFRHVFPDPARRCRALPPFFRATVRDAIPFAMSYAAWEGGKCLGVAVWLPPGAFPWSATRKLRATPAMLRVLAAAPRSFGSFTRFGANAEKAHPSDPHWYLEVLGVRPDAQRTGIGSRLMAPVLEVADRDGADCYLETSDPANIPYYERFGFAVSDAHLQLVPGGPPHTSMRRRPR
jgi:GNAT superfamily N-acetyltransferase